MKLSPRTIGSLAATLFALPAAASVLIFAIDGLGNFDHISQDYGDRIQGADEGKFHYLLDGGATPNVTVDYVGFTPSHWSTGYGDLADVLFDDPEGHGTIDIVLKADPGYLVSLSSFDLAAYDSAFPEPPIIDSVAVTADCSEVLRKENTPVSDTLHTTYDFGGKPVTGHQITISVRCANLGGLSDDIGVDNIAFSQATDGDVDCYADFNDDGTTDLFDFLAFVNMFNDAQPQADCDRSCAFDLFDFLCFTNAFNIGC